MLTRNHLLDARIPFRIDIGQYVFRQKREIPNICQQSIEQKREIALY